MSSSEFRSLTEKLSGTRLAERYLVGDLVSVGGMGAVYKGVQLDLSRPVAIKVLRPDVRGAEHARIRFEREAEALASLRHPHIVGVIDYGTEGGFPYLVMEYIEGQSLSDVLEAESQMSLQRALRLARHLLAALSAAHGAGLVHRDLKPQNVMLSHVASMGEFATLIDFGIARHVAPDLGFTTGPQPIGTPAFMAPEQQMHETVDHRADFWALGTMLYRLLTGRMPFGNPSDPEFLTKVLTAEPAEIPEALCPPHVHLAIRRALAKDPADRFPDAQSFLDALESPSPKANAPTGAAHPSPAPTPTRGLKRWLVLGALALVALCTGGVLMTARGAGVATSAPDNPPASNASAGEGTARFENAASPVTEAPHPEGTQSARVGSEGMDARTEPATPEESAEVGEATPEPTEATPTRMQRNRPPRRPFPPREPVRSPPPQESASRSSEDLDRCRMECHHDHTDCQRERWRAGSADPVQCSRNFGRCISRCR